MILVIAEKPSVAQSIAKVLGATSRKDGYMESGNYIVSWCFGHLVELADASSYSLFRAPMGSTRVQPGSSASIMT